MREGQLGSKLAAHLRGQNAIVLPMVAGTMSELGVADKYVAHNYWRGWMELKAVGETLTQVQLDFARRMLERGDQCCGVQFQEREWRAGEARLTGWLFRYLDMSRELLMYLEFQTTTGYLLSHLSYMQALVMVPENMDYWHEFAEYPVAKGKKVK